MIGEITREEIQSLDAIWNKDIKRGLSPSNKMNEVLDKIQKKNEELYMIIMYSTEFVADHNISFANGFLAGVCLICDLVLRHQELEQMEDVKCV